MGREAKAKAARRDPLGKAIKRAMLAVENRKIGVELALRTERFQSSFKTRVDLLQGTPAEIVDDLGAGKLAVDQLRHQGVDVDGIQVACALRMRRLQFFVTISPEARAEAAEKARAAVQMKAAFAA